MICFPNYITITFLEFEKALYGFYMNNLNEYANPRKSSDNGISKNTYLYRTERFSGIGGIPDFVIQNR